MYKQVIQEFGITNRIDSYEWSTIYFNTYWR